MLIASLAGTFVSVHTRTWSKNGTPGRRDVVNVLDPDSGEVFSLVPPREASPGPGLPAQVIKDAASFKFGDKITCEVEQRSFAGGNGSVSTMYILHDVQASKAPEPVGAGAKR